jgi:DNA repair exonuclease SbcCD ATPase subunit
LARKGLTAIVGRNGSGKSLLLNALSNVLLNSTPVTVVKGRSKRDLFGTKSQINVTGIFGKHQWTLAKVSKGKSVSYALAKDGRDIKIRTIAQAEAKIADLRKLSEDEFYSLVYIDSRRPNSFQHGSPAGRIDYFTSIFRLDSFDAVRSVLNSRLHSIRGDLNSIEEVKSQIKELGVPHSTIEDRRQLEKLKSEAANLTAKYSKLHSQLMLSKLQAANRQDYLMLVETFGEDKLTNQTQGIALKRRLKAEALALEEKKEQATKYEEYQEAVATFNQRRTKLLTELETLRVPKDCTTWLATTPKHKQKIRKRMTLLRADIDKLRKAIDDAQADDKGTVTKLAKYADLDVGKTENTLAKATKQLHQVEGTLTKFDQHFESHTDSAYCPVCLTHLSAKAIRVIKQSLTRRLKTVSLRVDNLKKQLSLHSDYEEAKKRLEATDNSRRLLSSKKFRLATLKKKWEALNEFREEDVKRWLTVTDLLKKAPPKPVVKSISMATIVSRLQMVKAQEVALARVLPTLGSWGKKVGSVSKLEAQIERVNGSLLSVNAKIPELQSRIDVAVSERKRRTKLRHRLQELETRTQDIPVYEALVDAYSNKGIKLLQIKRLAAMTERNLNMYSSLLYANKFRFKLSVDVNKFDVTVHRMYGKRVISSDVRNLSGAESRAFSFLLPLAILPMIPADRRYNVLILDEPTANMDPIMQHSFINDFLPRLNTIVPHIIVVTPLAENFSKAKVITVTNINGESRLS